jgi:anti-anti-sigma factor
MVEFEISSEGPRMFFLNGELDMATSPLVDVAIGHAVARGGPITLDLSHLTFIDSSGIGEILRAVSDLPSGCIILHGVHDGTQRVVDLMGVDQATNLHIIPCTVPV